MSKNMKRVDFENGTVTGNILGAALPMLVAQILNLLYNIVDRVYIARIPEVGTKALGAVDHYCICKSLWRRRCTAFFYFQREKAGERSRVYYEYFFFHGLCQWCDIDGDGVTICKTDFNFVWSF